jgi:hypothetical protein
MVARSLHYLHSHRWVIALHVLPPFVLGVLAAVIGHDDDDVTSWFWTVAWTVIVVGVIAVAVEVRIFTDDRASGAEELASVALGVMVGSLMLAAVVAVFFIGATTAFAISGSTVRLFEDRAEGWQLLPFWLFVAALVGFPIGAAAGCLAGLSRWLHPPRS